LQGRQPIALTATAALTELDLPLGLDGAAETARRLNRNSGQIMAPGPRPTAAARSFAKRSELSGGGTASMPVREKGRRSSRFAACASLLTSASHPQTAAKSAGLFAHSLRVHY